jgi:hypothetical protein
MKKSYEKDLASHLALDPYADHGNVVGVASARGIDRPAMELRNHLFRVPTPLGGVEGNTQRCGKASVAAARRSQRP